MTMRAYLFKAPLFDGPDDGTAFEFGIVTAVDDVSLFWALDESRDPYSCLVRPLLVPTILSVRCDWHIDDAEIDGDEAENEPVETFDITADTTGESLFGWALENDGWQFFERHPDRYEGALSGRCNDAEAWFNTFEPSDQDQLDDNPIERPPTAAK